MLQWIFKGLNGPKIEKGAKVAKNKSQRKILNTLIELDCPHLYVFKYVKVVNVVQFWI